MYSLFPQTRVAAMALVMGAVVLVACRDRTPGAESAAAAEPAGGALTIWSDSTELFMEHPALIVGRPGKFNVHLTDVTDFAPVRSGRITLRFVPRDGGTPLVVTQDAPRAPGIYGPEPTFTRGGIYDLTLLVESPQTRDSLTVRDLRVYATVAEAPLAPSEGDDAISFLKEQQWKTPGFVTEFATTGSVNETIDVPGAVEPAPGRVASVSAPISGLVDAAGVRESPAVGTRVTRGRVLARLTPALGESGSTYSEARARLREAEAEVARATRLYQAEAVPQRRVQEAQIRLQAANEALAGLGGGRLTSDGRVTVETPIAGIVTQRNITPGSRVDAGALLFTIVDPSIVLVQARVPAAMASRLRGATSARFFPEGDSRDYVSRRVVSVGSVIDSLSRTLPVAIEFVNSDGGLKIGATGRVSLRTGQSARGVLVPSSAVLDEDGRPIAYVQAGGEAFHKRALSLGGNDGRLALVLSGIAAGERVVSGAAYQVRLASLSTAVPAHGHEH